MGACSRPGLASASIVYPTGAGESRHLDAGPIEHYGAGQWFPDGTRVLVCGSETGRAERCYVQDSRGGPPRAVTPEDTHRGVVSPDGGVVLVWRGATTAGPGRFELYSLTGGPPRPVPGLDKDDEVLRWSPDGRSLIVRRGRIPARLDRVDPATGRRELIRTLLPNEGSGATSVGGVVVGDDPSVYAYDVSYQLSQLFLVQGAR